MDLNRVMHIEQSVHNLLANPEANHLTKLQQKEWQAIEIALQHLMQNTNGDKHGGQKRPAPQQSSSGAGQAPAATAPQAAAPPQSTPSQPPPSQPPQQASTTAGVQAPAWAGSQGATGNAASSHGIEKKMSSGGDGSLDSMLYELEMAIKAAQDERDAAHHGKHGHHAHHAHQNMDGAQAHAMSAPSGGGSTSETRVHSMQGPSRVRGDAGKAEPDLVLKMGDVVGYRTASYGPSLADNKKKINAALDNAGASPKEKALVLAMFMQETKHMDVSEGDRSKDGNHGGSANVSALNMNEAMLRGNGTAASPGLSTFDPAVNLNDQANVGKAAVLCLDGIRERGTGAWIAGHRGGAPAAQRHDDRGTAITGPGDHAYFSDFYTSVATDYAAIVKDPTLMTNDMRVENNARPQYG